MDRLTNRLLVFALPLVGFIFLGRGIASFISGDKADGGAVASNSAALVPSLAAPTQSMGEHAVSMGYASRRRLFLTDTPSSKPPFASKPLFVAPPSSHEQRVRRLENVPEVERLDSFPEVERIDRFPVVERIDSESPRHSMHQSNKPPTFQTDPTLLAAEDFKSENLAGIQAIGSPSINGVPVRPERRGQEPARTQPRELVNPHFKATPEGPIPNLVFKHEPVAADGPASEVLDDSRFARRNYQMPSATNQAASETMGAPRAQDAQQPHPASSPPEQDQQTAWGPVDLRNMELPDVLNQSKLGSQNATVQATSADKKRAREALLLGFELARRRSFNPSHAHFIEALQIVAQSLDQQASSNEYTFALHRGLRAYEEALDFQVRSDPSDHIYLNTLISRHDTSVLHHVNLDNWNREQCLREYMAFAEREIVAAVGREPIAAQAIYGLGRLQTHLRTDAHVRTHRALMLYQATLIVDPRHYSAANELGVLLASHGQLKEAVTALRHCVRLSPQPTAWENLAVVHWQLGHAEQARLASDEARTARNVNAPPMVLAQ